MEEMTFQTREDGSEVLLIMNEEGGYEEFSVGTYETTPEEEAEYERFIERVHASPAYQEFVRETLENAERNTNPPTAIRVGESLPDYLARLHDGRTLIIDVSDEPPDE